VRGDPSVDTQDWLRKTIKQRTATYLVGPSIQVVELQQCEEIHLLRHKTGYERLSSNQAKNSYLLGWSIESGGGTPAVRGDPSVDTQDWLRKTIKQRAAAYLVELQQCYHLHLPKHKTRYENNQERTAAYLIGSSIRCRCRCRCHCRCRNRAVWLVDGTQISCGVNACNLPAVFVNMVATLSSSAGSGSA
jgi:hypothetical protein